MYCSLEEDIFASNFVILYRAIKIKTYSEYPS